MSAFGPAERLALIGATSHVGEELKQQLARAGYPGSRVALLDLDEEVGLVTDYGDEARVVLEAARDNLAAFRVACFCGSPDAARNFAPAVTDGGGVVIDCTGALATASGALAGDGSEPAAGSVVSVPHPGSLLLHALAASVNLADAVVTLLLPASERASAGTDAMAREAAGLLSFGESETADEEVFGRRVAFDLWPEPGGIGERVADELGRLGSAAPRLFVLRAPVFHALSAAVWVPGTEPEDVREALRRAGVQVDARDRRQRDIDSPVRAAGQSGVHVAALRADGAGTWLWAVQDNFHAVAAAALRVVAALLEPPAAESVN